MVVTFQKFRRQNPFAPSPLQRLHHYYGFFRTCDVHPYFHTRTSVSLYFSVTITPQDSPVPFMSLCHAPVALTPAAAHTVDRFLMGSYPGNHTILRFRLHLLALTMLHQLFTFVQLHGTQLTVSYRLFPYAQYHSFWLQHLWVFCNLYLHTDCGRPASISRKALLSVTIFSKYPLAFRTHRVINFDCPYGPPPLF